LISAVMGKVSTARRVWASGRAAIIALILMAACLAGAGINQHGFWDDEASTALFARSLLHTGHLDAWDGQNLNSFHGGTNLDEHLQSREGIPLQHYVAAAGMGLFGESTWAARLPFLLVGLATLWGLGRWSAGMVGTEIPVWLPTLLLAANTPFLLYIAQCRYYALVMGFSMALLCAWSSVDGDRRRLAYAGGAAAALGLVLSNSMDAVAMVAACTAGFLHPRFRTRAHLGFVAMIGILVAGAALLLLGTADGVQRWQSQHGAVDLIQHVATLMLWQIEGLAPFQFLPLLPLPLLVLPWLWRRLAGLRPMAGLALTAVAMMLAVMAVVAVFSPQDLAVTRVADMRYLLPVLVMGPLVTAAAVTVLAAGLGRAAAAVLVAGIIFSNLPYGAQPSPQCTLCERVHELGETHPSGMDAVVNVAKTLPAGARTVFIPDYLTTAAMFYRPDLRYAAVLDPKKSIDPDRRAELPDYVFQGSSAVDAIVVGMGSVRLTKTITFAGVDFQLASITPTLWLDQTRPELPWHQFRADPTKDQQFGIAVFRRTDAPAP
jgi:hypothetical protein